MKITGERSDGSLDAEVDSNDGMIQVGLRNARQLATSHGKIIHFEWNDVPLAIAADSDFGLILRSWEAREPGDVNQIGPHPDPETTPAYSHGAYIVEI